MSSFFVSMQKKYKWKNKCFTTSFFIAYKNIILIFYSKLNHICWTCQILFLIKFLITKKCRSGFSLSMNFFMIFIEILIIKAFFIVSTLNKSLKFIRLIFHFLTQIYSSFLNDFSELEKSVVKIFYYAILTTKCIKRCMAKNL